MQGDLTNISNYLDSARNGQFIQPTVQLSLFDFLDDYLPSNESHASDDINNPNQE